MQGNYSFSMDSGSLLPYYASKLADSRVFANDLQTRHDKMLMLALRPIERR